jgi:aspartyl/asparaginyl beta-hydroxylase (cupin superfamily)
LFAAMRHGADRIRLAEIAREEATFRTYVVQTYKAEFVLLLDAAFPAQLQRVAWPAPFA